MNVFLIYDTYEEALQKADQEGAAIGLPYHTDPSQATRYAGVINITSDDKYALWVNDFITLTPEEENSLVPEENIVWKI